MKTVKVFTFVEKSSWIISWGIICLVLIAFAAGCSGGDQQVNTNNGIQTDDEGGTGRPKDEIVVVVIAEPVDLAWNSASVSHILITRNCYEPLVSRGPDGDLVPVLAESWERIDDTTWRFHLRPGVVFHDGEPFNAETVAWLIDNLFNPEYIAETSWKFTPGEFAAVDVVDELTVDIRTASPDPILPRRLYWLPIASPKAIMADPEFQNMVGTGPYELDSWNHGKSIVLTANPNYWGEQPEVKKVTFIWEEDATLRMAMVRAGEADIGQAITPPEDGSVRVIAANIPETPFIHFDSGPPLDDIRVRRAICMAIDRNAIVENFFSGFATPATQIITPDVLGYSHDIPLWPYDPAAARDLIDEARADGVPVDLELTIMGRTDAFANEIPLMEALQLWLTEVGLIVKVEALDKPSWQAQIVLRPIPEDRRAIFLTSHGNEAGDAILTMIAYYRSDANKNVFPDPIQDEMIDKAALLSGDDRGEMLAAVMEYQHSQIVQDCPLVHIQAIWGVSDRITWAPRFDNLILVNTVRIN